MAGQFAAEQQSAEASIQRCTSRTAMADNLEALARPLLALLQRISGLDSVYLTEIDWKRQRQCIRFASNRDSRRVHEGFSLPWHDTLCRRALEEGVRLETNVPQRWPDSAAARELGIKTYVSASVCTREDEILGAICGISGTSHDVPDQVLELMDMFARLLAGQIERERAAEAERGRTATAERSAALFAALSDIGQICSRARTLKPALAECAARLRAFEPDAAIDVIAPEQITDDATRAMYDWALRCCHQDAAIDGAGWWRRSRAGWAACDDECFIGPDCHGVGLASALHEGEFRGALLIRLREPLLDDPAMQQAMQSLTLHLSLLATRACLDANLRHAYAELERQSLSDPLTGLPNRRCFERDTRRLDAAIRRRGGRACVVFIDLDGFKAFNDRYGHDLGDRFLIEFGRRLTAATRSHETCARYGGDEFVVLAHINSLGAESIRERLATHLAGHFRLNGIDIDYPGPSIGIAVQHDEDESVADLVARADRSMYEEKQMRRRATARTDW